MPFADELIGSNTVQVLTEAIETAAPDAPLIGLRAAEAQLGPLSLRERSDLLRYALLADLPGDYDSFAATIRRARDEATQFSGWLIWPVTSAVAAKAIDEGSAEAFDDALNLLGELTSLLSSEFAIRALLNHDLDRAMAKIYHWAGSSDVDLRRLASEGTRPFLPWAVRVPAILAEPQTTLPILDALYRDEAEYVRRSVANHLNDLSRQEPELVVATATAWLAEPDANTVHVVRHGLRSLIKKGHPEALSLLGFTPARLEVTGPIPATDSVTIGETLTFTASVRNLDTEPAQLAIDYIVHHQKASGVQTGKTFKLTTKTLEPGETYDITREHSFKVITTRRYHPGAHAVELQINGISSGRAEFTLLAED
ncbi:DNA alkylation repair protein [Actinoalloteichus hymeniacidonis]|uniref:DNA alkylation repair enzyme n=1 Tax=Actinoalloteichus hymeniacidonis TaxID=340345 RepID=A0AAC9HMV0_9PSEU|nr:DNA alkylation repair protein [Actinoalloteichus hymeniacidonis]AOS62034.1 DNA alkylation repair enzyme [Actinoalloteichus hymeniacidonis]MBB5909944.1 3-methyladenine DNA glycosylase AlkC [Actinoalloteichus hymeniacidonis]